MFEAWSELGTGLALVFFLGQLLCVPFSSISLMTLAMLGSLGIVQLQLVTQAVPGFLYVPALFSMVPSLYLYLQLIGNSGFSMDRGHHYKPAIIASVLVLLFTDFGSALPSGFLCLEIIAGLIACGYLWHIYQHITDNWQPLAHIKVEVKYLRWMLMLAVSLTLIALLTALFSVSLGYLLCSSLISTILLAGYLLSVKYPDMTSYMAEEIALAPTERDLLKQEDTGDLRQKLNRLMVEEKLYHEPSLDLATLADKVGVTSHQLSQLLNDHLQLNFKSYIKQYRLDEAETLLKEQPKVAILDIGLAVGFSSSSAFYAAFKQRHQISPGQYRKLS